MFQYLKFKDKEPSLYLILNKNKNKYISIESYFTRRAA